MSRDIGSDLRIRKYWFAAQEIDPDIDEARHALLEDLVFSQMLAKVGFVKGVGAARPSKPRFNLTGDPYFTDGYRAVLFLDPGPIALNQVKALGWDEPETFHLGVASGH